MTAPTYLDHNATAPLDPVVLEAMLPWLTSQYGNASSRHEYGRAARRALDEARRQVAAAIGAHETEIVFTASGSEANNLFIKGAAARFPPGWLAISAIEHPSIRSPAAQLVNRGWRVKHIDVDPAGRIDGKAYSVALEHRPSLISIMYANNETGTLQAIKPLAEQALATGAIFHTDATQALGRIPIDFRELSASGVAAMTLSSHKIGGPKGAAALVVDKRVDLEPLVAGGGHERGLRAGTENIAAIVGFGVVCELAARRRQQTADRLTALRNQLERGLQAQGATIFGEEAERLSNTTFFALPHLDGETLVAQLDRAGFAVASGAACSSHSGTVSHVLNAMNIPDELARGAVRISLGADNTAEQIERFLWTLQNTVMQLRQLTAIAV